MPRDFSRMRVRALFVAAVAIQSSFCFAQTNTKPARATSRPVKPETPHLEFVSEYIRELSAVERIRAAGKEENFQQAMMRKNTTSSEKMHWYSALVAFESLLPISAPSASVFEIRAVLLRAGTDDAARKKAEQIGRDEQHEYNNSLGERITWLFREVLDVCCLSWVESFSEGTETYYAHIGPEGLAEIKRALNRTATSDPR